MEAVKLLHRLCLAVTIIAIYTHKKIDIGKFWTIHLRISIYLFGLNLLFS